MRFWCGILLKIDFWLYLAYFRENRRKWRKPRDYSPNREFREAISDHFPPLLPRPSPATKNLQKLSTAVPATLSLSRSNTQSYKDLRDCCRYGSQLLPRFPPLTLPTLQYCTVQIELLLQIEAPWPPKQPSPPKQHAPSHQTFSPLVHQSQKRR